MRALRGLLDLLFNAKRCRVCQSPALDGTGFCSDEHWQQWQASSM